VEVPLGHFVPLVELGDGAVTRERGERRGDIILQKEPCFLPPIRRIEHGEVEVGINTGPKFDINIYAIQNHRLCARALWEPDAKELVLQIEVGANPHIGLAQSYKGHNV
jgi:hypothetical protein